MVPNATTKKPKELLAVALLAAFMVMATGCAWPYGRIKSSAEVTKMFETNAVPKDYQYFYDGRPDQPYVIIGLYPGYKLASRFWDTVAPNTQEFLHKVQWIYYYPEGEASYYPVGSFILDAQGNPVGIWYSRYRQTAVIVKEDKSVFIYSPYNETVVGTRGFRTH